MFLFMCLCFGSTAQENRCGDNKKWVNWSDGPEGAGICQPKDLLGDCIAVSKRYAGYWSNCPCYKLNSREALTECVSEAQERLNSECVKRRDQKFAGAWPRDSICMMCSGIELTQLESCTQDATQNNMVNVEFQADCLERANSYGDAWPKGQLCNCEEIDSSETFNRCEEEAKGNARRVANVEQVNIAAACGDENSARSCCEKKKEFFKSFWPSDTICECSLMMRGGRPPSAGKINVVKQNVIACIEEADQKATTECASNSQEYIKYTTNGCRVKKPGANYGRSICVQKDSEVLKKFIKSAPAPTFDFYLAIENYLSSAGTRDNCIEESREKFISAYQSKCLGYIKELQEGKRQTLICDEGTKENPMCDQYCEDKAKEVYGDKKPSSDEIASSYFDSGPRAF